MMSVDGEERDAVARHKGLIYTGHLWSFSAWFTQPHLGPRRVSPTVRLFAPLHRTAVCAVFIIRETFFLLLLYCTIWIAVYAYETGPGDACHP